MSCKFSASYWSCWHKTFLGVMSMKGLREVVMFMRVLSAGLVVAGYAFLGVWLANWLVSEGWPVIAAICAVPVVAAFGMWQGWLFLTKSSKKQPPSPRN